MKQRKHYFEVTFAGVIFTAVSAFVLLAAVNSQTNLLFFAFGLMLGALLVSALLGAVMLRNIDIIRQTNDHTAAGEPSEVHYHITNVKQTWPSFAIRVTEARFKGQLLATPDAYCLHLSPGRSATLMTHLTPKSRGLLELSEIRIACSFPFGFVNRAIHFVRPLRIVVYPRIGELNRGIALRCRESITSGSLTSNIRGGHDEFYGIREYRAGDNTRAIHWRRTARTGELMIREMTTNAPPQMIVVLNLRNWRTHPDGLQRVEQAIELAASLICYGSLENYALGLFIPGDANPTLAEPRMGRDNRARLLQALAIVDPSTITSAEVPPPPIRGKARAEWVIVTLSQADKMQDILPPQAAKTILALDHPESATWVTFIETMRSPAPPVTSKTLDDSHPPKTNPQPETKSK